MSASPRAPEAVGSFCTSASIRQSASRGERGVVTLERGGSLSGQLHQFLSQNVTDLGSGGNSHDLYHEPLQALAGLDWQAISAAAHSELPGERMIRHTPKASACDRLLFLRQFQETLRHLHHAIPICRH
jgi:hypothetical protein